MPDNARSDIAKLLKDNWLAVPEWLRIIISIPFVLFMAFLVFRLVLLIPAFIPTSIILIVFGTFMALSAKEEYDTWKQCDGYVFAAICSGVFYTAAIVIFVSGLWKCLNM